MATLDPSSVNDELKTALEERLKQELNLLNVKKSKSTAFENARMSAAMKTTSEGKAPSEAACERAAKSDAQYLKHCDMEITATDQVGKAEIKVEYLRNKFQIALNQSK